MTNNQKQKAIYIEQKKQHIVQQINTDPRH